MQFVFVTSSAFCPCFLVYTMPYIRYSYNTPFYSAVIVCGAQYTPEDVRYIQVEGYNGGYVNPWLRSAVALRVLQLSVL